MDLPAAELTVAFALFVGAPAVCTAVCLWALGVRGRRMSSLVPSGHGISAASDSLDETRRRRTAVVRALTCWQAWQARRAEARARRTFLACFDDGERSALARAFTDALADEAGAADAHLRQTLARLRDQRTSLTVVTPPRGPGGPVLLVFGDATALVGTPAQRDAARLLAAELWAGPVTLTAFGGHEANWTLRFATPSAQMSVPIRRLASG